MARRSHRGPFKDGTTGPRILSITLIALMILLTAWSILNLQSKFELTDIGAWSVGSAVPMRWRVLTGAFFMTVYLWCAKDAPDLRSRRLGSPLPDVSSGANVEIFKAELYCQKVYDQEIWRLFTELLADLPHYLFRVNEDIRLTPGQMEATTTLHLRLSSAAKLTGPGSSPTILVPVIIARKGLLFDNLIVKDASGRVLPTLSQWEVRGLTAVAVRSLFRVAFEQTASAADMLFWRRLLNFKSGYSGPTFQDVEEIFFQVVTDAICLPSDSGDRARKLGLPERRLRALAKLNDLKPCMQEDRLRRLKELCLSLSENCLIVAEVPRPVGVNLAVSYSFNEIEERALHNPYEWRRAKLGLEPYVVDVSMPRVLQADSYHCQISAPAGLHVFSHHLEKLGSVKALKQENFKVSGVQQYVRLYHEESRTVAHLYVRRQGAGAAREIGEGSDLGLGIKSVVLLRETPPGVLGTAAVLAKVVAAITLFLTLFRLGLNESSGSSGSVASLPGFLFAIPAFIAAALGRGVDGVKLARSSLVTYYGLFSVFLLSVCATLLYAFDSAAELSTEIEVHLVENYWTWHTDWLWLVLCGVASGLAIYLSRECRDQTDYYLKNLQHASRRNRSK